MSGLTKEATLSCDAHSCESVVPGDHPASKMRRSQSLDGWCRARFQSIFENDETQKLKSGFRLFSEENT